MNKHQHESKPTPSKKHKICIRRPDSYKLSIEFKRRRIVTSNRYELISLLNDIITTICFLIGSYFFFHKQTETGTIMFIIGNANTLFRAIIALIRKFHIEWIQNESSDKRA
ncbi:YrhK family protein [Paenibacillus campi]|uniref:YrhK family protein n=1 Tax=Paenibacillus campi TaxID=3106031 RepID=UPI002B00255C|nr:YrhK family protein [Paenibacillus sp. SGZ-1014]